MIDLHVSDARQAMVASGVACPGTGNTSNKLVYFLAESDALGEPNSQDEFQGFVKIGFTTRPLELRVKAIQACCSRPLVAIVVLRGVTKKVESRIHDAFRDHCVHGEWFHLTGPLRNLLNALRDIHGPSQWTDRED